MVENTGTDLLDWSFFDENLDPDCSQKFDELLSRPHYEENFACGKMKFLGTSYLLTVDTSSARSPKPYF